MENISKILQNKILLKKDESIYFVELGAVYYFISYQNYVRVIADTEYKTDKKLYELEKEYSNLGFIRINKSQIVNIQNVKRISPYIGNRLILILSNNEELVVTKTYIKMFKRYLGI